ncbi:MAG: purine-nucleoside phosphorylase [Oscillospiraceae bacterium]|nr:purine-nucleoside phosphorylase [Oscillospiraceae bacterium]MBQ4642736.1 purine-nucleoside phosphorylase [Oscillospiraceae bacterium]
MTYNQVKGSAEYIFAQTRIRPKIAVILGSGLNPIASEIENAVRIPYKNIPRWNSTTNPDHEGVLIVGTLDKIPVAVMNGRLHQYEGNSMKECAYPIAVFKAMGIEKIIITNAAGGINTDYKNGDFVLISDHIKFFNDGPLTGEDASILGGNRFFDMSDTYSEYLRNRVEGAFETETGIKLHQGVYAFMPGPQFETPAEIRMLRTLGADVVGMSTVPEVIMAAACNIKVLGISVVSNMAAGVENKKLSGADVNETCSSIKEDFKALIHTAVRILEEEK